MIKVTAKDALRSEQLTPGWKVGVCVNFFEAIAKTDGSKVYTFEIEVEEKGMPVPVPLQNYVISEKAVSMGKAFFIACGFPQEEWDKLVKGEATSADIDPVNCVGKKFRVMVANDKYENRILNKAADFLPLQTVAA